MILPFLTVAAAFVLLCGDQIKMGVEGRGVWAAEPAHPAIIRLPVLVEGNGVTAGPPMAAGGARASSSPQSQL